mgnify:CR=1 FL=1
MGTFLLLLLLLSLIRRICGSCNVADLSLAPGQTVNTSNPVRKSKNIMTVVIAIMVMVIMRVSCVHHRLLKQEAPSGSRVKHTLTRSTFPQTSTAIGER